MGTGHQDECVLGTGHKMGACWVQGTRWVRVGYRAPDGCVLGTVHQDGCLLCVFSHNCHGLTTMYNAYVRRTQTHKILTHL